MPDTWSIVESPFDVRFNRHFEGLMSIGSGPLQQRASLEEGLSDDPQDLEFLRVMGNVTIEKFPNFKSRFGTYMPGVAGPHPTCLVEMINLAAIHGLLLIAGDERLDMEHGRIEGYRRRLDLRTARLEREFVWHTKAGARLSVRFERFISTARPHVMALRCRVRHESGPAASLMFSGGLDAAVRTNGYDHFETVAPAADGSGVSLRVRTNGGDDVAAAAVLTAGAPIAWTSRTEPRRCWTDGRCALEPGKSIEVCKFAALISSRHVADSPLDAARILVRDAAAAGFDALAAESDAVWRERWEQTDVVIDGDPQSQLALRVSLYHMLRTVVEDDPRVAIDAKAAAGEAYCGRYFWDTEIFMLPMFLYTRPQVGRTLARFRVKSLDGARRNARSYGYRGAKYAWESAPSGDDNCPNWQYADHEVHVTADAAYGLWHSYLAGPGSVEFLAELTEVLTETARYWCERVWFNPQRDEYEMLMVMGPDEYTPFSRNNAYTNHMTSLSLSLTTQAWQELRRCDARRAKELADRLGLDPEETGRWLEIAGKLRFPYDGNRRLVLQSDDFFAYEPVDFEKLWTDRSQPFGRCVSQERIYRSQVLKQADVLQLMALFPHQFDLEQMRVAYDTYEPLTTHDSSLSRSTHAIIAAWIGRIDAALRFWDESASLDLTPGAATEGIHAACAGANWQVAVFGFGGVRTRMQSDVLRVDPHLPARWTALRFPFVWRGQPLVIRIEHDRVTIDHRGDQPLAASICGQTCELPPAKTSAFASRQ